MDGDNRVTRTPLEEEVLRTYVAKLTEDGVPNEIVQSLEEAFFADKLPSPDEVLKTIDLHSGERTA